MNDQTAIQADDPKWLKIALGEKGIHEIPGARAEKRIVEYHQTCSLKATSDEIAWCSSFLNWCITQAGMKGTNSAAAVSWAEWGEEIEYPVRGCIVVMDRPGGHHVAFYLDDDGERALLFGGNQSDMVCAKWFSFDNFTNYRMPLA